MDIKEDFKNLNGIVKQMDDQIKLVEEVTDSNITELYGLNIGVKDVIKGLSISTIETMEEYELIRKLHDGGCDDGVINSLRELNNMVEDGEETKPFVEYLRGIFKDIYESIEALNELYEEKEKINTQISEATDNYFNFVNSDEYQEKKNKKIAEIKEKAEAETDIIKKKKLLSNIEKLEKSESLEFLFERIEKLGDKEISNIVDVFFNKRRSELVMEKFKSRLPKFGYNSDIYKYFFNFEEKFLPEEYHDLNNIFLFVVMRYISFGDTNSDKDSAYTSSVLLKMYNLLYHKYPNKEKEDAIINIIKRMDDYFLPYIDKFKEKNITSPNHPERIARDEAYEEKIRVMLIASLENEGIKIDKPMETEEMRKMLKEVMEAKQNQTDDKKEDYSEIIEKASEIPEEVKNSEFSKMMDEITSTDEYNELEEMKNSIDIESLKETAEVVDNVETNNTEKENDSDFVVKKVTHTATEEETVDVEIWKDMYDCYYRKNEDNTYTYYDKNNKAYDTVPEEIVLKLISSGSVTKSIL